MNPASPVIPREAQRATRLIFLAVGAGGAGWAALVPFAQLRAGLDEGALGLLLLGLGAGSILAMPLAGALVPRVGCRAVIAVGLAVAGAMLPALAVAPTLALLMPALLLFGAGFGSVDVAMNMQAILVERASGRAMMSGFHGLFSLGGIGGALFMALLLGAGLSPLAAALLNLVLLLVLLALAARDLLPFGSRREGPAFVLPHGLVLLLGAMCFVAFLAEGAVFDWGAVFLSARRGLDPVYAGLGYAAFSATMTLGRLTGDRVVARLGARRTVGCSAVLAAAGFLVVTLVPGWPMSAWPVSAWPVALAGFALVGAGCANIVPVLFTAVGRQRAMPESLALPAVTTLGYAGLLAGPAGIGLVAHRVGLPVAFLGVGALLLLVAACAGRLALSGPSPPR